MQLHRRYPTPTCEVTAQRSGRRRAWTIGMVGRWDAVRAKLPVACCRCNDQGCRLLMTGSDYGAHLQEQGCKGPPAAMCLVPSTRQWQVLAFFLDATP